MYLNDKPLLNIVEVWYVSELVAQDIKDNLKYFLFSSYTAQNDVAQNIKISLNLVKWIANYV